MLTESPTQTQAKSDEAPPERTCACVSHDRHDCVAIRYGLSSFDAEGDAWDDDECQCMCHDEFDEWNRED